MTIYHNMRQSVHISAARKQTVVLSWEKGLFVLNGARLLALRGDHPGDDLVVLRTLVDAVLDVLLGGGRTVLQEQQARLGVAVGVGAAVGAVALHVARRRGAQVRLVLGVTLQDFARQHDQRHEDDAAAQWHRDQRHLYPELVVVRRTLADVFREF